jgi:hypothetical protein
MNQAQPLKTLAANLLTLILWDKRLAAKLLKVQCLNCRCLFVKV